MCQKHLIFLKVTSIRIAANMSQNGFEKQVIGGRGGETNNIICKILKDKHALLVTLDISLQFIYQTTYKDSIYLCEMWEREFSTTFSCLPSFLGMALQ